MVVNQYNIATGHVETVSDDIDETDARRIAESEATKDKTADHVYYVTESKHARTYA